MEKAFDEPSCGTSITEWRLLQQIVDCSSHTRQAQTTSKLGYRGVYKGVQA